ncbi:universal stress protein [Rhodospirillaceae bacterium SYSU D60014]|jgi:nucleotide-binding universal stress UspA family protein|uniref:universal stress protein n=1 Tax=Virgifigura deserti TaxID=2268457 RepID=UPI000E66C28F
MKLLCATDGSRPSEKAVAYAVDIAKKLNAHLTFLTVTTVSAERASKTYFWDEEILAAGDAMIHQELSAAAAMAKQAGLDDVRCVTAVGRDIAEAIVAYAETNRFDQIIAGSSGRTGAARLLLGSVAGAVVSKAHCPVTIVR